MKRTIFFAALTLLITSCEEKEHIPEFYTDLGIGIIANGTHPNTEIVDLKYLDMLECTGIDDIDVYLNGFIVWINSEIKIDEKRGFEYWNCLEENPDFKCTGRYAWNEVPPLLKTTESVATFAHEFGHFLSHYEQGIIEMTAEGGCTVSHNCGDRIDSYYNSGRYLIPEEMKIWEPHPLCKCGVFEDKKGRYYYDIIDKDKNNQCDLPGELGEGILESPIPAGLEIQNR